MWGQGCVGLKPTQGTGSKDCGVQGLGLVGTGSRYCVESQALGRLLVSRLRPPTVLNSRTTVSYKCEAVPSRARIQGA